MTTTETILYKLRNAKQSLEGAMLALGKLEDTGLGSVADDVLSKVLHAWQVMDETQGDFEIGKAEGVDD